MKNVECGWINMNTCRCSVYFMYEKSVTSYSTGITEASSRGGSCVSVHDTQNACGNAGVLGPWDKRFLFKLAVAVWTKLRGSSNQSLYGCGTTWVWYNTFDSLTIIHSDKDSSTTRISYW